MLAGTPLARAVRPRLIDGFMPKIEELVDRSKGKIRADMTHRKITSSVAKGGKGLDPGEAVDSGTQGGVIKD